MGPCFMDIEETATLTSKVFDIFDIFDQLEISIINCKDEQLFSRDEDFDVIEFACKFEDYDEILQLFDPS